MLDPPPANYAESGAEGLEEVSLSAPNVTAKLSETIGKSATPTGRLRNLGTEQRPKYRLGVLREPLRAWEGSAAVGSAAEGEPLRSGSQQFHGEKTDAP
jgi:hypothetical protein